MKTRTQWPDSPSERLDRDRVVDLVTRVGERQLTWTIYDLQREMKAELRLRLGHPRHLSRHVHALDSGLVTPVSQRLNYGVEQKEGSPSKARHQWILTRRLGEFHTSVQELDDLERVYYALWVATAALGVQDVPTRAVTEVLRNVEELSLQTPRNTLNHLITLYRRNKRLVEKVEADSVRWSTWRPLGPEPEHPRFSTWVETYRTVACNGTFARESGHATLGGLMRELVGIAIQATRSSHWPAGHSVQVADIRAVAGKDERARKLSEMMRQRGSSLGAVLGDLCKERIAGRPRLDRPVVKVGAPAGGGTYYDLPGEPGIERRRLVVLYRDLQQELGGHRLDQLSVEFAAADQLYRTEHDPVVRAIGAARRAIVQHQMEPAGALIRELEESGGLLSKSVRQSVGELRSKLERFRSRLGALDEARENADQLLVPLGESLASVMALDRPLLTPDGYAAFLPQHARRGRSPAEFIANATNLRRFPNPVFTSMTDEDSTRAARFCTDRAEALCYLSERYQGKTFAFLREGMRILGRDLRHAGLVRLLLASPRPRDRRAGLAALVLLGEEDAVPAALSWLDTAPAPQDVVDALFSLLVMKQVVPGDWPKRVRSANDRSIRDAVTQVVLAARTDRWLLQR